MNFWAAYPRKSRERRRVKKRSVKVTREVRTISSFHITYHCTCTLTNVLFLISGIDEVENAEDRKRKKFDD
jgi:hypothetical protein